jgi:predicted transcriptional regulator of viral defense system/very-short-patch-repair endonuclease
MPTEPQVARHSGGQLAARHREARIAELARRQHGVVSRAQLIAIGFGSDAIDGRLVRGRLHVVHRGVYAVGHPLLTNKGRWMAALLAGGPGAVLSHRSAAKLWQIRVAEARGSEVTVTRRRSSRAGLLFHQAAPRADEVTVEDGIAVTTVARTLFDLAAVLSRVRLAGAINQAEARALGDGTSLAELVHRYPGHRGAANLRSILATGRLGLDVTRSELENRFLEFLNRRGLPPPEVNVCIQAGGHWFELDCLWRSARLAVELDSRAWHGTSSAFETDRARDRTLIGAGWRTARITWRQLHLEPDALERDLRLALDA